MKFFLKQIFYIHLKYNENNFLSKFVESSEKI